MHRDKHRDQAVNDIINDFWQYWQFTTMIFLIGISIGIIINTKMHRDKHQH